MALSGPDFYVIKAKTKQRRVTPEKNGTNFFRSLSSKTCLTIHHFPCLYFDEYVWEPEFSVGLESVWVGQNSKGTKKESLHKWLGGRLGPTSFKGGIFYLSALALKSEYRPSRWLLSPEYSHEPFETGEEMPSLKDPRIRSLRPIAWFLSLRSPAVLDLTNTCLQPSGYRKTGEAKFGVMRPERGCTSVVSLAFGWHLTGLGPGIRDSRLSPRSRKQNSAIHGNYPAGIFLLWRRGGGGLMLLDC